MIKTSICEKIGIKYPVFQGGMAHISDGKLAAAVSEAGGLGIISAASGDIEKIEKEIDIAFSITDKPFGVNIMLQGPNIDSVAKLVSDKKVPVVTTGAGNSDKYIPMWKNAGIIVIPVVASVAQAKMCERSGADAVIAEGCESGGHIGETTTMALVPQVCDKVNIPVIAAGGIADGRGVAAAFVLGAAGVQIGTAFLTCKECFIGKTYKNKVLKASDISTVVTGKRLGHPVRSLKSPFSRKYSKAEYSEISDNDLEKMAVGSLRYAVYEDDNERGCFIAGQIAGLVNSEYTARDYIEKIFIDAEEILVGGKKWVK